MKPASVAQAYLLCIELEDRIRNHSPELADEVGPMRAELHALLIEALRESNIPFADRADAARIAAELVRASAPKCR
jgi:hypothetical protein